MIVNELNVIQHWVGDAKTWLETFIQRAARDEHIGCVLAIGSAVRGRGHERSDLDLLVLYKGDRPEIRAPIEVDIRMYSLEQTHDLIAQGNEVICWALKFGRLIYDRSNTWETIHANWVDRLPMSSAEEAGRRAKKSLKLAKQMLDVGDEGAAADLLLAAFTQFAREKLIEAGIFPASRPELPSQLRSVNEKEQLADLLDDAMFGPSSPAGLLNRFDSISSSNVSTESFQV